MLKKKKNSGLIIAIIILFVIAIASIFFVSQSVGNATKIIDSKAITEATPTYFSDTKQLTEFNIPTKEQLDTKPISQEFIKNTEIDLKLDKPINAFSVTGNATLQSEAGLVRIILVDADKHEYLVYEINNLLVENKKQTDFENTCEETCVFEKPITAVSMKIQVEDATLNLTSVNKVPEDKQFTEIKDIKNYKQEILKSQSQAKIEKYNSSQKSWTAGETSVSNLSYEEQKRLFIREDGTIPEYLPNLQGFLNYKGGVFTLAETNESKGRSENQESPENPEISSENIILPDSWDWRNVHGENWNTPVKNQGGVPSCWVFAEVGTFESQINLYYNKHLNLNLSEQMIIDCANTDFPGYPGSLQTCINSDGLKSDFCRFAIHGLPDESCDPYVERYPGSEQYCSLNYICNNWDSRTWKNNSATQIHTFDEPTKKLLLIKKGVLNSFIPFWGHSMVLVGYKDYKSNWKTIRSCESEFGLNNGFCSNSGCISKECTDENATMSVCNNDIDYPGQNTQYGVLNNYKCLFSSTYGTYRWQYIDQTTSDDINATYTSCINGEIISEPFNPTVGQQECGTVSDSSGYLLELKQFSPGQGDTYWIFKNSWSADWGENGYANIALSNFNIVVNGLLCDDSTITVDNFPQYPFTPPTDTSYWPADFNNTINCEDKDEDGYCNWGISEEKPSTCPSFCKAEKDCDDSNPDLLGFVSKTNLNCKYKYETQQ